MPEMTVLLAKLAALSGSEVQSGADAGVSMSLMLAIVLAALALGAWWREWTWRMRIRKAAGAAGIKGLADPLASLVRRFQEENQALVKEEYLRRLFEALLNEIRQGVAIVDDQLQIKFSNRMLATLFDKKVIHRGRTLLVELQDHQIHDAALSALQTQSRVVVEIEALSSFGGAGVSSRRYLIEAAPLPAKAERGAWLMVHDITEQALTEQIRKDFVANASHELRTPLTLINGYIETLQSGAVDNPAALKRSLAVMEKHGKRIVRIIEDMLAISRLEQSRLALNVEPFSARACVEDALDHLNPMLEGRDVQILLDFPEDGGLMQGDRFYWDQVFTNLIENSLKENPESGLVVRISGEWFPEHCVLRVTDNGIGIPAHDLPFVFKRFYRGHKHHSPQVKGTGLGLSIVRRAVEAHGGAVEVCSVPGQETTFTMRVPLAASAETGAVA